MLRNRLPGLVLTVGAVVFSLTPTPAVAETATGAPSVLALSVADEREGTPARRVTLTCDPTGGNHPFAGPACLQLAKVEGNFTRLNVGLDPHCTKEYAPRTVTAHGFWRGTRITHRATYANGCLAEARTDAVFRF
ncbi:subtilase-type protease inhibitor [Allokutzneria sp. A3M-2-11 16]|uniref:SSI family serine proteinase inhibitor n=1 Tax=Allokutzneria sp. A3M-2-11 16 TaxID=2962043 RepID=UPI0020B72C81|nr:SSI family serine proteinase inhibitor [Allokutzneria sp. A3M-2-11 16]MCP3800980.1 subtilase-type protease inhibitor [Allokutzneria sp. A3M-2-11 16]